MASTHLKGVSGKGDVRICMIAGCGRTAIYRKANQRSERGYCRAHREFATSENTMRFGERCERRLLEDIGKYRNND